MEIKISSDADLNKLLDVIANDITNAHCNFRLFCKIGDSIPEFAVEINESNTFWHLTTTALLESAMLHLCRVYDQDASSLSLANLLETLKVNIDRFSTEQFKARLAENKFVESLAESNRIPPLEEIEVDLNAATIEHEIVKKLMLWRNVQIAHRGAKVSLGKDQILRYNPLSETEIRWLLDNALQTFNKYSSFFRASIHSPSMIGQDDYEYVLKYIRSGLEQRRKEMDNYRTCNAYQPVATSFNRVINLNTNQT